MWAPDCTSNCQDNEDETDQTFWNWRKWFCKRKRTSCIVVYFCSNFYGYISFNKVLRSHFVVAIDLFVAIAYLYGTILLVAQLDFRNSKWKQCRRPVIWYVLSRFRQQIFEFFRKEVANMLCQTWLQFVLARPNCWKCWQIWKSWKRVAR